MAASGGHDRMQARLAVGAALAFALMTVVLVLTPEATGFEFAVYSAYHPVFWLLALVGLTAGGFVAVRAAVAPRETTGGLFALGLTTVVLLEGVLFALPAVRGYPVYGRADVLTHVGYVRDIQLAGVPAPTDIYPSIHLLTSTLSFATGEAPLAIINSIGLVIPLFSVVTWYAFVNRIYPRHQALLTLPFAMLFVGGSAYVNPSPFAQSSLVAPFVLYLFVRERQTRTVAVRVALLLASVAIVLYHPLTTLFLVAGIVPYVVAERVLARGWLARAGESLRAAPGTETTVPVLVAVFLSWYYSFQPVLAKSKTVVRNLLSASSGTSPLSRYSTTVEQTSPAFVDLVRVAVVDYGLDAFLLGIAVLYALLAGYRLVTEREPPGLYELWFVLASGVFLGMTVVFLVFDLIVGFGRPLIYLRLFAVPLAGPVAVQVYRSVDSRQVATAAVSVLVVTGAGLGLVTLYDSPLQGEPSQQMTDAELDGAGWFFEHREADVAVLEYGLSTSRVEDALFRETRTTVDPDAPLPPPHFGYRTHRTMGASYEDDRYLVVTPWGRGFYQAVYPGYRDQWQYTPADFQRLQDDRTVARVYDNGAVVWYRVTGTAA